MLYTTYSNIKNVQRLGICLLLVFAAAQAQERFDDIIVIAEPDSLAFSLIDTENYTLLNVVCRGGTHDDVHANAQHVCENLEPCTAYISEVTMQQVLNQQEFNKTYTTRTAYRTPVTEIEAVDVTVDKINLTWSTTDQSCVSGFIVSVETTGQDTKIELLGQHNSYQFENLEACQNYNIKLVTRDNSSAVVSNLTTSRRTEYAEPGSVQLTITNLQNGETEIKWNAPEHKTCIDFYTLRWLKRECVGNDDQTTTTMLPDFETVTAMPGVNDEECEWSDTLTDPNAVRYVLRELQGCDDYIIEMYINQNETVKGRDEFTSAEKIPSAVVIDNSIIDATKVEIQWSSPTEHSKCLLMYQLQLAGPYEDGSVESRDTTKNSAVFDTLEPCGQYSLQITPQSLNTSLGASTVERFVTLEAQPTKILEPQVIAGAYSLEISWQKPSFADLCIQYYRLVGWREDNTFVDALSKNTSDTKVIFNQDLNSCQAYVIQIIAATVNMDGEETKIEVETGAAVVNSENTKLQVISTFSDGLELSAQSTDTDNMCQTIFAHFYCESNADVSYKRAEKYVEGHVGDISFKAALSPLSPYTEYACHVILYNIAGASKDKSIIQSTNPYFPGKPENLSLKNVTKDSLTVEWEKPKSTNGDIKLYILYLQRYKADYYVPAACAPVIAETPTPPTASLEHPFKDLLPATAYSVQVAAQNVYGIGQYTNPKIYITLPWISDPVTNVRVEPEGPYEMAEYKASVLVTWSFPCKSHGKIEAFLLDFDGERPDRERLSFQRMVKPVYDNPIEGVMSYNETSLQPEFNYTVTVSVKTLNVDEYSSGITGQFDAPAGIPKKLDDIVVANMRVSSYETNHPTSSAVVRIPVDVLKSDSGTILYMALLLSEKDCTQTPELRYGALDTNQNWPDTLSWHEVYEEDGGTNDCIKQYQTTPLRWKPDENTVTRSSSNGRSRRDTDAVILYTIGEDKCAGNIEQRYCNGPLKADTQYDLVIRLFTKSGYNDVALLDFKTESAIQVTIILVACCCCLLLAFVIGLMVLWIRKRIAWHRDSGQGIEDPFGNVIAKNFAIFYSEISKPEKIAREFKEISVVALDLSYSASELGCHKNRYADIYPYDKNRVILDIDADGSDYINASFIDGYTRKKEYIATQGPKPESTMDFWRMILQHNVRVIVQVTQFREGNQVKCHEYFPFTSKGINVTLKSKETFDLYDRTEMSVSHDKYGLKQKVIHFFFKKWPDHGCPEDPMHLITFVRKVKSERRPSYSPIVIHCSAGVGRTGTFIGLDIVMQRLKSESKINIFETVKKLRFQRMKMVQTLEQYSFLYKCTYELVKHKVPRAALKIPKKVGFGDDNTIPAIAVSDNLKTANNNDVTLARPVRLEGNFKKAGKLDWLAEQSDKEAHDDPDTESTM